MDFSYPNFWERTSWKSGENFLKIGREMLLVQSCCQNCVILSTRMSIKLGLKKHVWSPSSSMGSRNFRRQSSTSSARSVSVIMWEWESYALPSWGGEKYSLMFSRNDTVSHYLVHFVSVVQLGTLDSHHSGCFQGLRWGTSVFLVYELVKYISIPLEKTILNSSSLSLPLTLCHLIYATTSVLALSWKHIPRNTKSTSK